MQWAEDELDPLQTKRGVESVAAVVGRASSFVGDLEAADGPPLLGAAAGAAAGPAAEGYLEYRRQALGCGKPKLSSDALWRHPLFIWWAFVTRVAFSGKAGGCGSAGEDGLESWGVVLVAHGDVLQARPPTHAAYRCCLVQADFEAQCARQILQTAYDGVDPAEHRRLPHLPNAELRMLN